MGRLVEPPRRHASNQESVDGDGDQSGGDGFLERVVKYVPAEIIAAYLTLDRIVIPDSLKHRKAIEEAALAHAPSPILTRGETFDLYLPEIVFGLLLLSVFLYFRALAGFSNSSGARQTWFSQAFISAIVFVVWVYAMRGSVFELNGLFVDKYAAMMVPVFTLLSGMYRPSPVNDTATSPVVVPKARPAEQTGVATQSSLSSSTAGASQQATVVPITGAKHPLARRL